MTDLGNEVGVSTEWTIKPLTYKPNLVPRVLSFPSPGNEIDTYRTFCWTQSLWGAVCKFIIKPHII